MAKPMRRSFVHSIDGSGADGTQGHMNDRKRPYRYRFFQRQPFLLAVIALLFLVAIIVGSPHLLLLVGIGALAVVPL
jgi:hypothetical protein